MSHRLLQTLALDVLTKTPRYQDPKRLLSAGFKVYSQGPEDGMIHEIFRRIGTETKRFVEFGVQTGLECNTTFLLMEGWQGAWIEPTAAHVEQARATFADYPVEIVEDAVTVDNADRLISSLAGDDGLDLLSIDIDSNDFWVWQAIQTVQPRLVIVEYNATLPPFVRKTIKHDPQRFWNGTNYFGASLGALTALGEHKGYRLVGCTLVGTNAFFVRDDLVGEHFCSPFTAENHYEPPRYELIAPQGHPPGFGPWVDADDFL